MIFRAFSRRICVRLHRLKLVVSAALRRTRPLVHPPRRLARSTRWLHCHLPCRLDLQPAPRLLLLRSSTHTLAHSIGPAAHMRRAVFYNAHSSDAIRIGLDPRLGHRHSSSFFDNRSFRCRRRLCSPPAQSITSLNTATHCRSTMLPADSLQSRRTLHYTPLEQGGIRTAAGRSHRSGRGPIGSGLRSHGRSIALPSQGGASRSLRAREGIRVCLGTRSITGLPAHCIVHRSLPFGLLAAKTQVHATVSSLWIRLTATLCRA